MKNLLRKLLALAFMSVALFALAPFLSGSSSVQAQELPPYNHIYVKARIEFEGISKNQLFEFITNMENDELWWEGVESTEMVSGSLNGPFNDRAYLQTGSFNGFPYTNVIDITGGRYGKYMSLEAESPFLAYRSRYDFHRNWCGNVIVTSTSWVDGYGITPELMSSTIEQAFENLEDHLGVESDYTLVVGKYITP
jgi:hypothetical protein